MRVLSIDQTRLEFADNLHSVQAKELGRIVAVVGPNGAGKTRILHRVLALDRAPLRYLEASKPEFILEDLLHRMARKQIRTSPLSVANYRSDILSHLLEITTDSSYVPEFLGCVCSRPSPSEIHLIVKDLSFQSQHLDMEDTLTLARLHGLLLSPAELPPFGVDGSLSYLSYLKVIQYLAVHDSSPMGEAIRKSVLERIENLDRLIETFFGEPLSIDSEGFAVFQGRRLDGSEFTEGQKALLRMALTLHTQNKSIITVIDEPEKHLHPRALLKAISAILRINSLGQLWVATHSIPLIAHLFHEYPHETTFLVMEKGSVQSVGRRAQHAVLSMVGEETNLENMTRILESPIASASAIFAAECLLPPRIVAKPKPNDPQINIIHNTVYSKMRDGLINLLDFGAGDGRLLYGMLETMSRAECQKRVNYVAYDRVPSKTLLRLLEEVYGANGSSRIFTDYELFSQYQENSFDIVVMCNALHEIDPKNWLVEFGSQGIIRRSLKRPGFLLIVEDHVMRIGEHAHDYRFVVLPTYALVALFSSDQESHEKKISVINSDGFYAGRIKGHLVPAILLGNVTNATRTEALKRVQSNAKVKALEVRAQPNGSRIDYRAGNEYAFWTQQVFNVTIALDELGKE